MTRTPCAKCPFRKDVPNYLRPGRRVEIAHALLSGAPFHCHGTVDYSGEDDEGDTIADTSESLLCAGAERSLAAAGTSSQMGRIAERLGLVDLDAITADDGVEVWNINEWQHRPDDKDVADVTEVETCSIVNSGCLAPAGYAVGGGVVYGTVAADMHCDECGEPVCSNCMGDNSTCPMCRGEDDDDGD